MCKSMQKTTANTSQAFIYVPSDLWHFTLVVIPAVFLWPISKA